MQLGLVGVGYAAVLLIAARLVFVRYMQYVNHPEDVVASSGMYAFGDTLLEIRIIGLFMIPTIFLAWVIAQSETIYTVYSHILLGLSLTAPICLSLLCFGKPITANILGEICLTRLLGSPLLVFGMGFSRWMARSDRSKRLTSYALLIEGLTLGVAVALIIYWVGHTRH